ncbi:glycoside hydrolase superfamily [Aspergillus heterothallicus]
MNLVLSLLLAAVDCVAGFTYTAVATERYATLLKPPASTATTSFGPRCSDASTLLLSKMIYSTYTLAPSSTWTNDGQNGQSAYNALWASANFTWSSTMPFSTTVSPTPIPSSELVFPPPLPIPSPRRQGCLPHDFIWGVAGSARQIEGALQAEGRGPAPKMDEIARHCASRRDRRPVLFALHFAWTQVLPFGVAGSPVNQPAIDHYNDVINTCLEYGITPIVTLWHFNTPLMVDFDNDSIKFANNLAYPLDGPSNTSDVAASARYQSMVLGMMGNSIFLGKQIPAEYLETAGVNVTALTPAQVKRIHGTADFFSIDPYTAQLTTAPPGGIDGCAADPTNANWPFCVVFSDTRTDCWIAGDAGNNNIRIAPEYVRQQLNYLWDIFKPAGGILITEFVANEKLKALDQQRFDLERSLYYYNFLTETINAIREDGVKVIGALAWSFVDINEFGDYAQQFGLQTVNRTTFERTYKRSLFDFVDFFQQSRIGAEGDLR